MSEELSRYVQIDDWIFEVKMVRAIRTKGYGEPYSATASLSLNGSNAFIDGLMTKDEAEFTREDYQTFRKYFQKMKVDQVNFDRYKKNKLKSDTVAVEAPIKGTPVLQLVLG